MLEIMKLLVPNLVPQKVLVDFEKTCMNTVRIAFPHAEVKAGYFHLCQSLIRKLSNVGLKTEFETDINIKPSCATFPHEDSYNEVLTYIEGPAGRDPQFPVRIWNLHDAVLERWPRTTNCCEGFHNALNSLFHCSHPRVWFLFDGLQRDLACHRLTLANAQADRLEVKKRRYNALHDLVATSVHEYEQVEDKLKYLGRLVNLQ
jgi:hypothetical protein